MLPFINELIDKHYKKRYCSFCDYCCASEDYSLDKDGVVAFEQWDNPPKVVFFDPTASTKVYWCSESHCVKNKRFKDHTFTFDFYPDSWKDYEEMMEDRKDDYDDGDYQATPEWCYEMYYKTAVSNDCYRYY